MRKKREKKPDISVIIMTRETPLMILKRCITSIREQTLDYVEIILLDANSPHNTYQDAILCEEEFFQGVVHIKHPESGEIVHGKNLALEQAKSDYITFISAQDVMPPGRLSTVLHAFRRDNNYCVYYTGKTLQENNTLETFDYTLASGKYQYLSQAVFHRSCFQLIGAFDEDILALSNEELWFRVHYFHLDGYVSAEEAAICVCPDFYENCTPLEAAISYRQISIKFKKILKQSKSMKRDLYYKIAENYKKSHALFRYLQFQLKATFCK